jgi:hypothetical protein
MVVISMALYPKCISVPNTSFTIQFLRPETTYSPSLVTKPVVVNTVQPCHLDFLNHFVSSDTHRMH